MDMTGVPMILAQITTLSAKVDSANASTKQQMDEMHKMLKEILEAVRPMAKAFAEQQRTQNPGSYGSR